MALLTSLASQTFDQPSNSIRWGNGRNTELSYIPANYAGGGGGATGEDVTWMSALAPSLAALGYQMPEQQMMSGDGGIDANASMSQAQGYLDYLRSTYGDGQFAIGSTRLTGSDSDGGGFRNDLFQRGEGDTWSPIDGSGYASSDTGYKSDGRKVGTILASFVGGLALNGAGVGAEAAAGAEGGSAAAGASEVPNAIGYGTEGFSGYIDPATGGSFGVGAGGSAAGAGDFGAGDGADGFGETWSGGEGSAEAGGDGAFLGEGSSSGVPEWDAAASGAGAGSSGFDPNGLPDGSTYASDFPTMPTSGSGTGASGYLQGAQALLGAGASLYGSHLQDRAARDALNATLAQTAQARADSAPWRVAGGDAVGLMSSGIQPGGYFSHQFDANDLNSQLAPNYAFMLDQGQRANQNAAGVGGGLVGGNALKGLQDYTQNYAQNAYQQAYQNYTANQSNIFNRLASIAGLGQTANQANSVLASNNMANGNNYLTSGAAANAAGVVGATNSVNNGINNYLGWNYLNSGP